MQKISARFELKRGKIRFLEKVCCFPLGASERGRERDAAPVTQPAAETESELLLSNEAALRPLLYAHFTYHTTLQSDPKHTRRIDSHISPVADPSAKRKPQRGSAGFCDLAEHISSVSVCVCMHACMYVCIYVFFFSCVSTCARV